jgi:voltage-gated potassium channel Kch
VQVQLAATHLLARFAFRLVVVVVAVKSTNHLVVGVVVVNCLLAEPALLAPVCRGVAKRGLITATPYLVVVLGVLILAQVENLSTVVVLVAVAMGGLVLAALVEPAFMVVVVAMAAQATPAALAQQGLSPAGAAEAVVTNRAMAATELLVESSSLFGKEYKNDLK